MTALIFIIIQIIILICLRKNKDSLFTQIPNLFLIPIYIHWFYNILPDKYNSLFVDNKIDGFQFHVYLGQLHLVNVLSTMIIAIWLIGGFIYYIKRDNKQKNLNI